MLKVFGIPYDASFDGVAVDTRRLGPYRYGAATIVCLLAGATLSVKTALIWGAAVFCIELISWITSRRVAKGEPPTELERAAFIATALGGYVTWLTLSLIYWSNPAPAATLAALLIWTSLLLNAVSFAFRSRSALLLLAIPVTVTMIATPALAPRFSGAWELIILSGLVLCGSYAWLSAYRNVVAARKLATLTAELEAQRTQAVIASDAKSAFLAMMSHELRTPMNGVLGMAHALDQTVLDGRQRDFVQTLLRSGDGLLTILNDILDLAKIESGRFDLESKPFDLRELVLKAHDLYAEPAREKGLELVVAMDFDVPRFVLGDGPRVGQILLNLVSNAVKFTGQGEVRVEVFYGPDDGNLKIVVRDTGPGIPADVQSRLFQGFTQGDSSIARQFGGTGLGLAISRNLARLMGGDITLDSQPARGARFTVQLPLAVTDGPRVLARPVEASLDAGLRVLVVDDNPTNLTVASALLAAVGAQVTTALDGATCLELAEGEVFDVILMDIQMPGMTGIEALHSLRAGGGPAAATPVVALTANAMVGERDRLLSLGFDDYLSKPLSPGALLKTLDLVTRLAALRSAA